jgi:DNA-binding response OmpR family regulator
MANLMKKVLIVEDDKFLANAYRVKLTKAGFDIQMAHDGEQVFTVLQTFQPDLIILDLVMPKKDGFSVLTELKKTPTLQDIPVIIASNLGQQEDIERGKSLGAIGYIIKTDLSLDDLVVKINEVTGATAVL